MASAPPAVRRRPRRAAERHRPGDLASAGRRWHEAFMRRKRPWRERWLMAGSIWAEHRRRYRDALERLERLEGLRPLDLREKARKAMLLLRAGEAERSHDLFLEVREAARSRGDAEHRYLLHHALAWLAYIRLDPFDAREQERKAAAIDCSPRLKRTLWVGDPDRPDPLDQAFDAWIEANPPSGEDLRKRRWS